MARFRKRGDTWHVIYYDRDGRRLFRSTKCGDRRAAEAVARRLEREAQDPDHAAKNETSITSALEGLIDHMQELVTAGRRSPATVDMHRYKAGQIRRIFEVDAATGEHHPFRLAALSAKHVDRFISQRREEGAAENTISKELVTLRTALKLAKRRGEWSGDTQAVMPSRFAPEYRPRTRFLSQGEVFALLPLLPADHAARLAFAVATSANQGETRAAMRCDISDAVLIRGTKRTSRLRTVPMATDWQRLLIAHAAKHARGEGGKLFLRDKGFRSALHRACDDAEISRCSSNDLRRTFCHWMRQSGLPRELVAAAMGHGSTAMVDKVYGKLTTEELAMLMARATGTPVAQTSAVSADLLDSADSAGGEKRNDLVPEEGLEPTRNFSHWSLSPGKELPKPREYKRKREYGGDRGTPVAQRQAAGGVVLVFPKRPGGAA